MTTDEAARVPRRSQAQRRQESADRLLTAGLELIAEQGFARTTLSQIGERAGYSRETVRLRHGSKQELLSTALQREYEARLLEPSRDVSLSGLDRVLGVVDALRSLLVDDDAFLRAVFVVSFESISSAPELHDHIERWLSEIEESISAALESGQGDGSVDPVLDCVEEGRHWAATAVGLAFRWCQDPTGRDYDAMLRAWRGRLERSCTRR